MVVLPEPERPVNQSVKPLCMRSAQNFAHQDVDAALGLAIGGEVNAAFLLRIELPPPPAGALPLTCRDGARARRAPNAGVACRVQRMHGDVMLADICVHLFARPIG